MFCQLIAPLILAATTQTPGMLLDQACSEKREVIGEQLFSDLEVYGGNYVQDVSFEYPQLVKRSSLRTALEELVGLGFSVIPTLVSEIDSEQPTSLTVKGGGFGPILTVFDKYDVKRRTAKSPFWKFPYDIEPTVGSSLRDYRYRRGDLAFFALGQILNRWYGRPSAGQVWALNSPLQTPTLAKYVRRDWSRLTRAEFKQSLRKDVLDPDLRSRQVVGFARFRDYFPKDARALALECMQGRPKKVPSGGPVWRFYLQLQPLACPEIDAACYNALLLADPEDVWDIDDILNYLRLRPEYLPKALSFAAERLKRKKDRSGIYANFISRFSPK